MDNNPLEQSKTPREAKGRNRALSESENDTGKAQPRPRAASFRQTSRSDNVQPYPESHTYVAQVGNYGPPQGVLSMGNIAPALPGYPSGPTQFDQQTMQQPHFVAVAPAPGTMYSMHQFQTFPGPPANPNMIFNAPYMYVPYLQQHQHQHQQQGTGFHGASGFQPLMPTHPGTLGDSVPTQVGGYGQGYYNPNMYAATQGHHSSVPNISSTTSLQRRRSHPHTSSSKGPEDLERESQKGVTIVDGSTHMRPAAGQGSSADSTSRLSSNASKPSTPRAPPRKPKQSGHALWVGNLAPGTSIVELKDYFAQDATKDLESVFLISKSNCAFVNYKTEEACLAALSRFHDTRLRGARLVCRVRRGLMSPGANSELTGLRDPSTPSLREGEDVIKSGLEDDGKEASYFTRAANRYFIVKSLTVEDLEVSRQSGIWATQTHNEESLNRAFENADNVYLIFSANKSGEYYGYARMMSAIKEDESLTQEMPPRSDHRSGNEPDNLDIKATAATTTAPNGRIITDAARGTIFWEADTSEDEEGIPRPQKSSSSVYQEPEEAAEWGLQLIGRPFRIRWLSTEKVPFHRTRGLRNPWNANREVKIARDGTELEPSVGEKLVLLFHPDASGQGE